MGELLTNAFRLFVSVRPDASLLSATHLARRPFHFEAGLTYQRAVGSVCQFLSSAVGRIELAKTNRLQRIAHDLCGGIRISLLLYLITP